MRVVVEFHDASCGRGGLARCGGSAYPEQRAEDQVCQLLVVAEGVHAVGFRCFRGRLGFKEAAHDVLCVPEQGLISDGHPLATCGAPRTIST